MSTRYVLNLDHQGPAFGDFCVFQTYEDQDEDIRSLVWFCKAARPDTQLKFYWELEYSFAWSEEGVLDPGVVFRPSEVWRADPMDEERNSVAVELENGAYHFSKSDHQTPRGQLGIRCVNSVPSRRVSVGIGMSGSPAFARPADPSLVHTFPKQPRYWIAFGDFEAGEVIDPDQIAQKYEITFQKNQQEKTIRFTGDNKWEEI